MNTPHPYDLVIGLDRSDKKADLCLIDTHSGQRRSQTIDTAPEALWEWLLQLRQDHPGARVALCLEQPAVRKAKPASLTQFYYLQGSRSPKLLAQRLALVQKAVPVTDESAVIDSFVLRVQLIARQLQLVQQTVATYDQQIAQAYAVHPDREIFASLPGAGPVLGPRLLASLGSQRERFPSNANLQCYSGVAPVTKKSGGSCYIHRRYLCPKFNRQGFHEYAKESVLWCRGAAAYYLQQRSKGSSHHTAVRALAFKWQRVIWKCWQDRTPYRDQFYEAALRRRGSDLVNLFDRVQLGKSPVKNPVKKS
jgi:hypothetical protein